MCFMINLALTQSYCLYPSHTDLSKFCVGCQLHNTNLFFFIWAWDQLCNNFDQACHRENSPNIIMLNFN